MINFINMLSLIDELFPDRWEKLNKELKISEVEEIIVDAIATLTPNEQTVIKKIWGLGEPVLYKFKDIAKVTGIKAGQIRRIEEKAYGRLQHSSRGLEKKLFI